MRLSAFIAAFLLLAAPPASAQLVMTDEETAEASQDLLFGEPIISDSAVARFKARGEPDVLATMALALRYRGPTQALLDAISDLAGEPVGSWHNLMLWMEAKADYKPHPSYQNLKLALYERIDPNFLRFLGGGRSDPDKMDIRLEEIVWGGVRVDGIPSLDDPTLITADEAAYLKDDDLVFGVAINGDVRAYPLRIMGWHEMFNETIGGVPVALAYCTLCGAAILFETHVEGREKPLVFGSSGFLYRSNKLMFDRETDSLWNQFTGKPVAGPLRGSGIELKVRPVATTTWARWRKAHPNTKVLSKETGFARNYGSGVVYKEYFASPELMFPAIVRDESVAKRKDRVFGIRGVGASRAWPVAAFADEPVINDAIAGRNIVLVGEAENRTVRAYDRGDRSFKPTGNPDRIADASGEWRVTEEALVGPGGERLARVPGHLSYWFAWDGYFGQESTLYGKK